jgi:hypothetical protein
MTPEEMQKRIEVLERFVEDLQKSSLIPLGVDQAFRERFSNIAKFNSNSLSGIMKANGGSTAITAISPLSGNNTFYAAPTSGASPTTGLNFTNGILVSVS